jgi:DNA-binding response OmpR family regulator
MAQNPDNTTPPKILLVDDSESVRKSLKMVLEHHGFLVTPAANVAEALHLIDTEPFDVLLSDLHMPGPGDGFTVVSAMRHKHPDAVTLLFTGYPALKEAMDAILLQADEILVKPIPELVQLIRERLDKGGNRRASNIERVASILEREASTTVADWLRRVGRDDELTSIVLSDDERSGHLQKLLQELVHRLRVPRSLGTKQVSEGAVEHGHIRRSQGYSIPMIIEESRMLQVSIFHTLQNNLSVVDFSLLLIDVMAIADEVDSQLKQAIMSFTEPAIRTRDLEPHQESGSGAFAANFEPVEFARSSNRSSQPARIETGSSIVRTAGLLEAVS